MAEYIEREALLCLVRPDDPSDEKAAVTIATAKKLVRSLASRVPAADVAPVRHGRHSAQYIDDYYGEFADCMECGTDNILPCNYCRNCGAKMDGGKNDA